MGVSKKQFFSSLAPRERLFVVWWCERLLSHMAGATPPKCNASRSGSISSARRCTWARSRWWTWRGPRSRSTTQQKLAPITFRARASPALEKFLDEALTNAIDHALEDETQKTINQLP